MGRNNINKTILAIGIIFLFICMSFNSISGIQIQNKPIITNVRGNTLYVGGNGSGNYSKIQDAIDNASDGDTVFVYDDSSPYYENIVIDKSINLIGEDKNTTIIDGNSNYIIIPISSCVISGFSITNGFYGIYPYLDSGEHIIISDNHFVNCVFAIRLCFLSGDFDSNIISNSFKECQVAISSDVSGICIISNNIIISSDYSYDGTGDLDCYWGNYVITNNTFICDDTGYYRRAIRLGIVTDCIIEGNEFNGYDSNALILDEECYNNLITHNNFTNNFIGIDISGDSFSNKIIDNNFINNKNDALIRFPNHQNNLVDGNYWDDWIGNKIKLPIFKRIPKILVSLTFYKFIRIGIAFDFHPASEPYDI